MLTGDRQRRGHGYAIALCTGLLFLGLAGCGGSTDVVAQTTPVAGVATGVTSPPAVPVPATTTSAAGPTGTTYVPGQTITGGTTVPTQPTSASVTTSVPASRPSASPTLPPAPTPFAFPAHYGKPSPADSSAVNHAYQSFLADVAGFDGDFDPGWVARLQQVATSKVVTAVQKVGAGYQSLGDHTQGALRDSHVEIKTSGSRGLVIDCLDEVDWYIVDDKTGDADQGATRGDYEAFTNLVHTAHGWKVSLWKPGQYVCQY
jgi:hypothetical protein